MKLTIDTDKRTITIHENVPFQKLIMALDKMFNGKEWMGYTLLKETEKEYIWTGPWITYDRNRFGDGWYVGTGNPLPVYPTITSDNTSQMTIEANAIVEYAPSNIYHIQISDHDLQ
jgi:hypothetical protein